MRLRRKIRGVCLLSDKEFKQISKDIIQLSLTVKTHHLKDNLYVVYWGEHQYKLPKVEILSYSDIRKWELEYELFRILWDIVLMDKGKVLILDSIPSLSDYATVYILRVK